MKQLQFLACAAIGSAICLSVHANAAASPEPSPMQQPPAVNGMLGLAESRVQPVIVQGLPGGNGYSANLALVDGRVVTLQMWPHSVRDAAHQVLVQVDNGQLVPVAPEPVWTVRGVALGFADSVFAGAVQPDGLWGTLWLGDGTRHWVEPLHGRAAAGPDDHIVYRSDDVLGSPGECGNEAHQHDEAVPFKDDLGQPGPGGNDQVWPAGLPAEPMNDGGTALGGAVCVTQLGIDADFEFFQDYGSSVANVQNRVNLVINTMNPQYENQCGISHTITTIIVRSSSNDPYTSNNSDTLLCQFLTEWTNNQGAVVRDVAKLFTGREIDGSTIGQATNFGEICDLAGFCQAPPTLDDGGYCHSQSDCCGTLACATDLAAHELGHLWSATHCCAGTTMNPSITCANNFAASSINQIVAHRNAIDSVCLQCGGGGPANDNCAAAVGVGNGNTAFSNVGATTDGPDEPNACNFFNYTQVGSDVWYRYTASCTGTATVDLCNSTYDTKLAVYGANCPGGPGAAIACNDDFCGTEGLRSRVTFAVNAGSQYLIRIGGYQGATGTGTMAISCAIANDACNGALVVGNGNTVFSTIGAATNGPDEPNACNFFNYTQVGADIFYRYTATCTGQVTVDLCNSSYDTKLAIYNAVCPVVPGTAIACNDDACGTQGLRSRVTFNAVTGLQYIIRIGGYQAASGTGTMSITCAAPQCPADIAPAGGNGTVNVDDLLAVINAWGACAGCPADIAPAGGNGVVNVDDLLAVINAWGPCP